METVDIDHGAIKDAMMQSMLEFDGDVSAIPEFEVNTKAVLGLQRVLSAKHAGVGLKKPIKRISFSKSVNASRISARARSSRISRASTTSSPSRLNSTISSSASMRRMRAKHSYLLSSQCLKQMISKEISSSKSKR